eukprot:scaffold101556_cov14-Tisochrysis_lutea.AAC.1
MGIPTSCLFHSQTCRHAAPFILSMPACFATHLGASSTMGMPPSRPFHEIMGMPAYRFFQSRGCQHAVQLTWGRHPSWAFLPPLRHHHRPPVRQHPKRKGVVQLTVPTGANSPSCPDAVQAVHKGYKGNKGKKASVKRFDC